MEFGWAVKVFSPAARSTVVMSGEPSVPSPQLICTTWGMFGCGSVNEPLRFGSPLPAETVVWSRLKVRFDGAELL